jgi:hypothetical protein
MKRNYHQILKQNIKLRPFRVSGRLAIFLPFGIDLKTEFRKQNEKGVPQP